VNGGTSFPRHLNSYLSTISACLSAHPSVCLSISLPSELRSRPRDLSSVQILLPTVHKISFRPGLERL